MKAGPLSSHFPIASQILHFFHAAKLGLSVETAKYLEKIYGFLHEKQLESSCFSPRKGRNYGFRRYTKKQTPRFTTRCSFRMNSINISNFAAKVLPFPLSTKNRMQKIVIVG